MDLYTGNIPGTLSLGVVSDGSSTRPSENAILYETREARESPWNKLCLDLDLSPAVEYRLVITVEGKAPENSVLAALDNIQITPNSACSLLCKSHKMYVKSSCFSTFQYSA